MAAGDRNAFDAQSVRRIANAVSRVEGRVDGHDTKLVNLERAPREHWTQAKNDGDEDPPAYAVLRIVGLSSEVGSDPALLVDKPNETVQPWYAVNGPDPASATAEPLVTLSSVVEVLYDEEDEDPPQVDEVWGPKPDEWKLFRGYPGFRIIGGHTTGEGARVLAQQSPPTTFMASAEGGGIPARVDDKPGRDWCLIYRLAPNIDGDLVLEEIEGVRVKATNLQEKSIFEDYFAISKEAGEEWVALAPCCSAPAGDCLICNDELWLELSGVINDDCEQCTSWNCAYKLAFRKVVESSPPYCAYRALTPFALCNPECGVVATTEDEETGQHWNCHPKDYIEFSISYNAGTNETTIEAHPSHGANLGLVFAVLKAVLPGEISCEDLCDLELPFDSNPNADTKCDFSGASLFIRCADPEIVCEPPPEPTTEEPTTEEPTTEEPTTEEPTTAEPTTEEPTTAEPTTEEPTTAEPTTEEPTTDEENIEPQCNGYCVHRWYGPVPGGEWGGPQPEDPQSDCTGIDCTCDVPPPATVENQIAYTPCYESGSGVNACTAWNCSWLGTAGGGWESASAFYVCPSPDCTCPEPSRPSGFIGELAFSGCDLAAP